MAWNSSGTPVKWRLLKSKLRVRVHVGHSTASTSSRGWRELVCAQGSCELLFLFEHSGETFLFPPRPSLNEGETEGYVKLTVEEIAVKRSQHFFLPECFSFPVLPLMLAFSRHLDPQKTFY